MVDYSKWKDIEISDDEDDTHPNIDTPSLFRWRHQARMERMEEMKQEKEEYERQKRQCEEQLLSTKKKLEEAEKTGDDLSSLKFALQEIEAKHSKIKQKEDELRKKEKVTPWNVDTISNPGFTKTVINKAPTRDAEELTEEEKEQRLRKFVKENEPLLKKYGLFRKYDDSKKFLMDNPHLASEDTANYLVIYCINLEMEGKHDLMEHVAHQCICMQYILELAKQLNVDPRACISSFFSRIQIAEVEYKKSFDDELYQFKERIRKRAAEKIKEAEEEERQERLGPGGLDPVEVFNSLPPELQKCFESQDIPLLQETLSKMPEKDAVYHMKRCVDSGLWVPEGSKPKDEEAEATTDNPEPVSEDGDDSAK